MHWSYEGLTNFPRHPLIKPMHGFVAVFAISLGGKPPAAAMLEGGGAALAGDARQRRTTSFQHRRRRRLTSHPLGWEALAERIYEWLSVDAP